MTIVPELTNFDFENNKEYIFSFSRFVNFDKAYHGVALEYFFNKLTDQLERKIVSEDDENYQVTYSFCKTSDVIKNLDQKQMLFLCCVFHVLDLKKYLVPLVSILIKNHNMEFSEIKKECKSDTFKINVF